MFRESDVQKKRIGTSNTPRQIDRVEAIIVSPRPPSSSGQSPRYTALYIDR
jgi:hypothetical protein